MSDETLERLEELLNQLAFHDENDPEDYCGPCGMQVKDGRHFIRCPVVKVRTLVRDLLRENEKLKLQLEAQSGRNVETD